MLLACKGAPPGGFVSARPDGVSARGDGGGNWVPRTLETTPAGIDSALQRAHKTVHQRLPERSQQAVLSSLEDAALREVVDRYVDA